MSSFLPRFSWFLLVVLLLGAGCAGTGRVAHDSAEEAYKKGMEHFEQENYGRAAEYLQSVFDYGRSNEWAADAQFNLGRAYYQDEKYLLAASAFTRFKQLYRQDERVPEAEYRRAMANYELSPPYQMDQTKTKRAVEYFQLFLNRYPNSEYVPEAEARIRELREKLAHKQYNAAQLYERRGLYEAAALSYESVFDQYPDTEWADDALLGAINAYLQYSGVSVRSQQPERLRLVIENYDRLVQLFPNSPLLKEAEALYEKAQARLDELESRS